MMTPRTIESLMPLLQLAIGPVILISGVGLLLLTMTNRLGRVVDRSRILGHEFRTGRAEDPNRIHDQLEILTHRAHLLRSAIWFGSVSVLLDATLMIVIFVTALFHLQVVWLIVILFVACLLSLILSLVAFIRDLDHSLTALFADLRDWTR